MATPGKRLTRRSLPQAGARGQTLLLFALTLLLLTLLVCMTLSFGTRVKEKMEAQTVADASAYSNAVQTARAFNAISLLTRAEVSIMVAQAAVESLISWSSYYRGNIDTGTWAAWDAMFGYSDTWYACQNGGKWCNCKPGYPVTNTSYVSYSGAYPNTYWALTSALNALYFENQRLDSQWDVLDTQTGLQALALQGVGEQIYTDAMGVYSDLQANMGNQSAAKTISQLAGMGSPWAGTGKDLYTAPESSVALREVQTTMGGGGDSILTSMGTRGDVFVRTRSNANAIISSQLTQVVSVPGITFTAQEVGSGYWGDYHTGPDGRYAYGDDHGHITMNLAGASGPCPPLGSYPPYSYLDEQAKPSYMDGWNAQQAPWSHVRSTDLLDLSDQHRWYPHVAGRPDVPPADKEHTLGFCDPNGCKNKPCCPGVWVGFTAFNPGAQNDVFAQPKNYVITQRDYLNRGTTPGHPDPWNLAFNFRFASSGPGEKFDNQGLQLTDGTQINKQTLLAAGIAYYHRYQHWREPPNFINPFWRATLISADVDAQGTGAGGDIPTTLRVGGGDVNASNVATELWKVGYKGFH